MSLNAESARKSGVVDFQNEDDGYDSWGGDVEPKSNMAGKESKSAERKSIENKTSEHRSVDQKSLDHRGVDHSLRRQSYLSIPFLYVCNLCRQIITLRWDLKQKWKRIVWYIALETSNEFRRN